MKRAFDIIIALIGLVVLAPVMAGIILVMLLMQGRPIFYIAERMRTPERAFNLIKFRTMIMTPEALNTGVTGGDKVGRITPIGRWLRRYRLDEVPQLFNILKGDMSFVGPRPPLRQYTDLFPELYAKVLRSRPGVTGLASLHYHRHEERLIAATATASETEAIYMHRCIPRKATLDLIYQRHATVFYDAVIMWQTAKSLLKR